MDWYEDYYAFTEQVTADQLFYWKKKIQDRWNETRVKSAFSINSIKMGFVNQSLEIDLLFTILGLINLIKNYSSPTINK